MIGYGASLLLAAAAGYWVLERSVTQKQVVVRRTGQILGWAIILLSLLGVLAQSECRMGGKGFCPFSHGMKAAPGDMPMPHAR